eukprot:6459936-Amphidinium_carterae.1
MQRLSLIPYRGASGERILDVLVAYLNCLHSIPSYHYEEPLASCPYALDRELSSRNWPCQMRATLSS